MEASKVLKKGERSNSQPVKKNDISSKKWRLGRKTATAHPVWRVIR
jgi:hypothetical protein